MTVDFRRVRIVILPILAIAARHEQHLRDVLVAEEQDTRILWSYATATCAARRCDKLDQNILEHVRNGVALTVLVVYMES